MTRLYGYLSTNDRLTQEVFRQYGAPLSLAIDEEGTGLGIGWVQDGRSLLRKKPRLGAGEVEVTRLVDDIPARGLLAAVTLPGEASVSPDDTQPFRFRRWVAAQNLDPALRSDDDLRAAIAEELPDFLRRNVGGASLEELTFHLFLQALHPRGAFQAPIPEGRPCAEALAEAIEDLEGRLEDDATLEQFGFLALSERLIVGARVGEPLYIRLIEGLEVDAEKPLFAGHRPKPEQHPRFRGLLVTSHLEDDADRDAWREIPDDHIFWVDRDWELKVLAR